MKTQALSLLTIIVASIFSCTSNDDSDIQEVPQHSKPNILLIIADDMGLDATPGYTVGNIKPNMPTLQGWMNSGIKFNNLWSNPTCSPTRGTIITGKYGFRTGVTEVGNVMSTAQTSLQTYLDNTNSGYSHAVVGKWHIGGNDTSHPTNMGVGYYAGSLGGGVPSYTNWSLTENAQTNISTEYATTKYTDLAINWIDNQTQPWFLWLAYNAAHTPFHLPPNDLHYQANLPSDQATIDANPLPYYLAMLEAMDTEMGRLIDSMSEEEKDNTVIIFIGDNGTPGQVAQEYNNNRVKGTLFQGGVNVPMVISGKNVSRINAIEDALINTTDLFATISELAGNAIPQINDSRSFKELLTSSDVDTRNYVYSERGEVGSQDYTIRNATHKYISFNNGNERFYNLSQDPLESTNLLNGNQLPLSTADSAIKDELIAELNIIRN